MEGPNQNAGGENGMEGGKRSAWMTHVKKTMRANKGKSLSQVLKMAKKTYKKSKKGGVITPALLGGATAGVATNAGAVGGRRRRGSRKSRGTRKH